MMKSLALTFGFLFLFNFSFAQQEETSEKIWDDKNPLQAADFKLKTSSNSSFALFTLSYNLSGLDFMTKNFNKKVKNIMLTDASFIDLENVEYALAYQQILFDISEVYARQLRKSFLENRWKLAGNIAIAEEFSDSISTEMSKERSRFEQESKNGNDRDVMKTWKQNVDQRISALAPFSYENDDKIKLHQ